MICENIKSIIDRHEKMIKSSNYSDEHPTLCVTYSGIYVPAQLICDFKELSDEIMRLCNKPPWGEEVFALNNKLDEIEKENNRLTQQCEYYKFWMESYKRQFEELNR